MIDDLPLNSADENLKQHLRGETAPMRWIELAPFFARGQLIVVSPLLDLLDVAVAMSRDRRESFERWMASGEVKLVDDQLASLWNDQPPTLLAVVIAPWVLVQHLPDQAH
jgi:hypothetical protein